VNRGLAVMHDVWLRRTDALAISPRHRVHSRSSSARLVGIPCAVALCLGVMLVLGGCVAVPEDKLKKAKGYYQEGIANLDADRQQAFVSFQKAIQNDPRHKEAHYYLGHLYALQGKYPQAEEEFREVIRIDPDYPEAYNYLGQVLEPQDRWAEAIESYRRALSNPLYATPDVAWFRLGQALAHEGDMEKATQAFEDALRITPPNVPPARIHLELGRAYYKLGYDTKAREELTRVSTLDKGGEYAAAAAKLIDRLRR
jgi:type IV pilus assembly protein PilF